MTNQVLIGKEQILKDVITLAEDWLEKIEQSNFFGGSVKEIREFQKTPTATIINNSHEKLEQYLLKLPFDDIKMLQTVMYLGRDKDYDKTLSITEIYDDYFNYLGKKGWDSKEIEINQMTEKMPLSDYLKDGLKILEISI